MTTTPREAALEKQVADLRIALELAREASKDLRRAGRAEALAILLQHGAENIGDLIGSHPIADTGDYGEHWDEPKLRELLDVTADDPALSLIDRLEGVYWDQVAEIDALNERAPAQGVRYRHKKTAGIYERIGDPRLQSAIPITDMARLVLYRGQDGALWARPPEEFNERFEPLAEDQQAS
ncbi:MULTISPECIES: hypothetical protein [unclassified Variovorax]|uniref:hypothetical protein n=1 Tax=unclassified Variovorax TaxID=663243 RepID=UPI00076C028E|nr:MULTISPECIES: hypothetical protein [unclassified Variovorax]KWT70795.1 hypothetical protein APY03_6551 [Variovorax sp. WDL1]PNG49162.1 hypothetical protein CHC06_06399 [Variovorax sp. B2]PNG49547.1 hypothetical protein CHC07_06456 [Variovorax sp. B4]VTV18802.1 hypothetical protein WDL1P2_00441 [Variovorax sp. WDL1]